MGVGDDEGAGVWRKTTSSTANRTVLNEYRPLLKAFTTGVMRMDSSQRADDTALHGFAAGKDR